jgi:hypothetical protein
MTIILRRFNINNLNYNSLIAIIGMFGSGKSFITKDILFNFNDIPVGTVISEIARNQNIHNYIPPIFIHDKYEQKILKNFIKRQESLINNEEYDSRSFLIFENCLYGNEINKDKYFEKIIKSNKEYNFLCIIEAINLVLIKEKLINNIDYLFILKDIFDINKQRIYNQFKNYLGIEYTLFSKIVDDYTNDYNFLILDLKSNSVSIEDKLFWYKASKHENFKMCSDETWDYNNKNYIKQPLKKNLNRSIFY